MRIFVCKNAAIFAKGGIESVSNHGIVVSVLNVNGKKANGCLSLVHAPSAKESFFEIREGKGVLPFSSLEAGEKYKVFYIETGVRVPVGTISIIKDDILGLCALPQTKETDHLYEVVASMMEYLQFLRDKIENHIDGNDVV